MRCVCTDALEEHLVQDRYRISRGLPTVIGDVIIRVEDYEDPDGRDNVRKLVEEGMVEA